MFKVHVLWHSHILLKSNTVELWSLNCYLFFSIDEQWVVSERSTWMVQKMERGIMEWRTWSTSGESPADVRLNGGNVGNYILHMHILHVSFFPPWSNPQCLHMQPSMPSYAFYYLLTKNFSVWKSVIYRHINYGIEIKMNTVRICLKITYNSDVSIIFGSNYEVQHSPSKKLSPFDSF